MDRSEEPRELCVLGDVVSRRHDVVSERGTRRFCIRRTKTGEAFVPRSLFVSLLPWDILIAVVFALFRRVPTWFSKQWQVGVFFQPNVNDPGPEVGLLVYEKFDSSAEAEARQAELVAAVSRGDFDKVKPLAPKRNKVITSLRKIAAID